MKKAFTLVELLVAVLLITLLIGTALFAYRQTLINIKKTNTVKLNSVLTEHQLRTAIESMQYYVLEEKDMFNNGTKKFHFFFHGTSQMMTFITINPTFSKIPSIVKLECLKGGALQYTEEPLYKRNDLNNPQVFLNSKSTMYWEDLKQCQFNYLTNDGLQKNLNKKVPNAALIQIKDSTEKPYKLFIRIKSNYHHSKERIYDRIYGDT